MRNLEPTPEDLRSLAEHATPGKWTWWTSCSWRRLRAEMPDGKTLDVIQPCVARYDGHPDLTMSPEDQAYIQAAQPDRILKLLDVVDAAREMRKAREGTEEHFNRRFSLDTALAALGDAAP